jgi:hypothetical protein
MGDLAVVPLFSSGPVGGGVRSFTPVAVGEVERHHRKDEPRRVRVVYMSQLGGCLSCRAFVSLFEQRIEEAKCRPSNY